MLKVQGDQLDEQRTLTGLQTPVLELQATELRESLDERKREAEERRSTQASRVFMWEEHPWRYMVSAHWKNASEQPAYEAQLRWHRGSEGYGDPNPEPLGTIMPGAEGGKPRTFPDGTNMDVSGAVLRFRDAAGITWMRRPDGGLTQQQP